MIYAFHAGSWRGRRGRDQGVIFHEVSRRHRADSVNAGAHDPEGRLLALATRAEIEGRKKLVHSEDDLRIVVGETLFDGAGVIPELKEQ